LVTKKRAETTGRAYAIWPVRNLLQQIPEVLPWRPGQTWSYSGKLAG